MAKHALMSPSGAERWAHCAGSVSLSAGLPEDTSSYAAEGSCAHEVAARCLLEKQPAAVFIGHSFHDTVVTAEMAEHVDAYTPVSYTHLGWVHCDISRRTSQIVCAERRMIVKQIC